MATNKNNVNPNHYKVAGRQRQVEDILQTQHKRKHAVSLVRGRSTPHTRTERPALIPGPPPRGAASVRARRCEQEGRQHRRKEEERRQEDEHEQAALRQARQAVDSSKTGVLPS